VRILLFMLMLATICWTSLLQRTRQELIWLSSNFRALVFYRSLFRACKRLPITLFIFVWDWKKSSGRISAKSSHLQMTVLRVLKQCSRHRFITAAEGVAAWSLISICEYFCGFAVAYVLTSHSPCTYTVMKSVLQLLPQNNTVTNRDLQHYHLGTRYQTAVSE